MDADEREIYFYLKSWRSEFISAREICRRAGGKQKYRADENWGKPALTRMVERGILESDNSGHYRIKPPPSTDKKRRWVSPQVAKILQASGKDFKEAIVADDADDNYYESL